LVNFGLSTLSQALTLLNFFQTNNLTRIFLLTRENNFSKEFKTALNNVLQNYPQIRVLGEFELKYFGDQPATQLEKTLQSLNPQVVLFTLNLAEAADFFMSLDEEIKTRFVFVGTSIIDDQDEIRKFSNIFAGTLYPSFYLKNESSALNQLFSDEYRKKFGGTPDMFSALGFDAGLFLISTWKSSGALNKSTLLQEAQRLSFLTGTPLVLPEGVLERLLKIVEIQQDGSLKSVN
jgi:ABC-type branched-subunit amino acid transport system substrate-binding protein